MTKDSANTNISKEYLDFYMDSKYVEFIKTFITKLDCYNEMFQSGICSLEVQIARYSYGEELKIIAYFGENARNKRLQIYSSKIGDLSFMENSSFTTLYTEFLIKLINFLNHYSLSSQNLSLYDFNFGSSSISSVIDLSDNIPNLKEILQFELLNLGLSNEYCEYKRFISEGIDQLICIIVKTGINSDINVCRQYTLENGSEFLKIFYSWTDVANTDSRCFSSAYKSALVNYKKRVEYLIFASNLKTTGIDPSSSLSRLWNSICNFFNTNNLLEEGLYEYSIDLDKIREAQANELKRLHQFESKNAENRSKNLRFNSSKGIIDAAL